VSFIVTSYNLPVDLLRMCLDSILSLSLRAAEREIILIDDGSKQSPLPQLDFYVNDIIYVRQANKGLSEARNTGIRVSSGLYIQFVDGDDMLIRHSYEHCLDIVRYKRPDMMLFDYSSQTETPTVCDDATAVSGTTFMRTQNLRGTAWGYLFRRSVLGELRFTPGIWHEDEEFTPQMLIRAERVVATDAKAYFYYKHKGTITSRDDAESKAKRFDDIRGVMDRLQYLCDRVPQNDRVALQRRLAQLTMDYIYQVIVQQRSQQALDTCIEELTAKGLFPLPDRDYTRKYKWFRTMTNTRLGRTILLNTLPLLKRER
jgi:hypothetical protein